MSRPASIKLLSNGVIVHGRCHTSYADAWEKRHKNYPGTAAYILPGHSHLTPGRQCEHCHKPLVPRRPLNDQASNREQ